jgi:hypothetical protein
VVGVHKHVQHVLLRRPRRLARQLYHLGFGRIAGSATVGTESLRESRKYEADGRCSTKWQWDAEPWQHPHALAIQRQQEDVELLEVLLQPSRGRVHHYVPISTERAQRCTRP